MNNNKRRTFKEEMAFILHNGKYYLYLGHFFHINRHTDRCISTMYPEYIWCHSIYSIDMGRRHGWSHLWIFDCSNLLLCGKCASICLPLLWLHHVMGLEFIWYFYACWFRASHEHILLNVTCVNIAMFPFIVFAKLSFPPFWIINTTKCYENSTNRITSQRFNDDYISIWEEKIKTLFFIWDGEMDRKRKITGSTSTMSHIRNFVLLSQPIQINVQCDKQNSAQFAVVQFCCVTNRFGLINITLC